jgi:hypothetical protein
MINKSRIFSVLLTALCLACLTMPVSGYHHQNAHRKINELALKQFLKGVKNNPWKIDEFFKYYSFQSDLLLPLKGESIVREGFFYPEDNVKGWVVSKIERGPKELKFPEWLAEGGFTADEPEFYSSLRHFYDPLAVSGGKAYLTDHVAWLVDKVAGFAITEPEMNAVEWAIEGPARNGYVENPYSWKKGLDYLEKAFKDKTPGKTALFASAWRSLGETMHLLADMTQPAHVRNDAHPWDINISGFKLDPYEYFIVINSPGKGDVITQLSQGSADFSFLEEARQKMDIAGLFKKTAAFTNENFFSADTVSGIDPNTGTRVTNGNRMPAYPSPKLDNSVLDTLGYYEKQGRILAHMDWANNTWWNARNTAKQRLSGFLNWSKAIDSYQDVVISQATRLVPLAVNSCSLLIDWFIPRVAVLASGFDKEKREWKGQISHTPYGALQKPLLFNKGPKEWSQLSVNNYRYSEVLGDYELTIEDGEILCKLTPKVKLKPIGENQVSLKLFMGGFWVESREPEGVWQLSDTWTGKWANWDICRIKGASTIAENQATTSDSHSSKGENRNLKYGHTWNSPPREIKVGTAIELALDVADQGCQWGSGRGRGYTALFLGKYGGPKGANGEVRIPGMFDWACSQGDSGPFFEGKPVGFEIQKKEGLIIVEASLKGAAFLCRGGGSRSAKKIKLTLPAGKPGDKILIIVSSGHGTRATDDSSRTTNVDQTIGAHTVRYYEYIRK